MMSAIEGGDLCVRFATWSRISCGMPATHGKGTRPDHPPAQTTQARSTSPVEGLTPRPGYPGKDLTTPNHPPGQIPHARSSSHSRIPRPITLTRKKHTYPSFHSLTDLAPDACHLVKHAHPNSPPRQVYHTRSRPIQASILSSIPSNPVMYLMPRPPHPVKHLTLPTSR